MKQKHADYKIAPYPKFRRFEAIMLHSLQSMPMMHGLIEVDVTRARAFMREHKAKTGETLSFTAFIITCLAKAVDENKSIQAYRKGRNRLFIFEDVDVNTQIERELDGQKSAIPYTVRAANRKTFRENSSRDQSCPRAGRGTSRGGHGFQSVSVPTDLALQNRLVGPLVERENVSPGVDEVHGNSRHNGCWYVWERCRLGYSSCRPQPLYYAGRHWQEARCRGRADSYPRISEYDD